MPPRLVPKRSTDARPDARRRVQNGAQAWSGPEWRLHRFRGARPLTSRVRQEHAPQEGGEVRKNIVGLVAE